MDWKEVMVGVLIVIKGELVGVVVVVEVEVEVGVEVEVVEVPTPLIVYSSAFHDITPNPFSISALLGVLTGG
jgi:hypothetical protein